MKTAAELWGLLVSDFDVPEDFLKNFQKMKAPVRKGVQEAVLNYALYQCEQTRTAVLRALDAVGAPSSQLKLVKYRLSHIRHVAKNEIGSIERDLRSEEEKRNRQLELAVEVLRTKFDLPAANKTNAEKREITIGGIVFQYDVRSDDAVDWTILDPATGSAVKVYSGDPPERLGAALNDLALLNDENERIAASAARPPDAEPVPWQDSAAYKETDGDANRGKA